MPQKRLGQRSAPFVSAGGRDESDAATLADSGKSLRSFWGSYGGRRRLVLDRAGQDRQLDRTERCRQNDDYQCDHGLCAAEQWSYSFRRSGYRGWRPERIANIGLVRTFQNAATFASASVVDNLATGYFLVSKTGVCQTLLRTPRFRLEEKVLNQRIDQLLDLLKLQHRRHLIAGSLPYGEQRVLGLGIALMTRPSLLLLDEPAAGLNPDEAKMMGHLIKTINEQGITVLLVEHNMSLVMSVSSHIIVVKQGKLLAEGTPASIRKHPDVVEAYLGAEA